MKKKILIFIIIVLVIFISFLSIYKFNGDNSVVNTDLAFTTLNPKNKKIDLKYDYELDEEKYKEYILDDVKTINFTMYRNDKSVEGRIYIDNEKKLHITDDLLNYDNTISNLKVKTIKADENDMFDAMYVYLITEDKKLFYMSLKSNNVYDAEIYEIFTNRPVLGFSDISYENDISPSSNTLFVLCDDGNIYEVSSGLRYHENIKLIFDNIMIYEDNTISNVYGGMFEDENGKYYKIKYIFNVAQSDTFLGKEVLIIITEDNEAIIALKPDRYMEIHVADTKVKTVEFEPKFPFVLGKLTLVFENGKRFELQANCSTYFCINEFDI